MLVRCKGLSHQTGDAGVAVKDTAGRVKLNQLFQRVAKGAMSWIFWGSLVGIELRTSPD